MRRRNESMYAIVEIAGKQFRVAKDMKIKVPLLDTKAGESIDFERVLLFENDKGEVTIGTPILGDTNVSARVIEHGRDRKVIVFKKKRRKGYKKKQGHRQGFSLIEITGIGAAKKTKTPLKEERKVEAVPAKAEKTKAARKPAVAEKAAKPTAAEAKPAAARAKTTAAKAEKTTAAKKEPAAAKTKTATVKKTSAAKSKASPAKKTTKAAAAKKNVKED